jgi:hypothetical protein
VERPHVKEECNVEKAPHVVDIVQPTFKSLQDAPISKDFTKEEMFMCSLLSLLHLHARCTQGKKLLLLITCCDICTLSKCPIEKPIDKVATNDIKKFRLRKGRKSKPGR